MTLLAVHHHGDGAAMARLCCKMQSIRLNRCTIVSRSSCGPRTRRRSGSTSDLASENGGAYTRTIEMAARDCCACDGATKRHETYSRSTATVTQNARSIGLDLDCDFVWTRAVMGATREMQAAVSRRSPYSRTPHPLAVRTLLRSSPPTRRCASTRSCLTRRQAGGSGSTRRCWRKQSTRRMRARWSAHATRGGGRAFLSNC